MTMPLNQQTTMFTSGKNIYLCEEYTINPNITINNENRILMSQHINSYINVVKKTLPECFQSSDWIKLDQKCIWEDKILSRGYIC